MDWKTATTDEKLARMEQRLAEIETAKKVLDEFVQVTRVWLKKVRAKADTRQSHYQPARA